MPQVQLLAAVFISGLLFPMGQASASCANEPSPKGSPIVFAGRAISERAGYTRFAVDEVHSGPDLAPEVWVRSGQDQGWLLNRLGNVSSSTDADFDEGKQYVVGADALFDTSSCTSVEDDGSYQTSTSRGPVETGARGADPPIGPLGQFLGVAGALAFLLALVVAFTRFRRNRGNGGRHAA